MGYEYGVVLLQRGVGEHGEPLPLIEIISRSTRVRQTFDAIVNSGGWDAAEEAQQRTLFGPGTTKFPTKILKEMIEGSISQENMDKKQLEALYEKAAGHELFIHLRETEQWDNLKLSLTYVLNDYDQLLLRLRNTRWAFAWSALLHLPALCSNFTVRAVKIVIVNIISISPCTRRYLFPPCVRRFLGWDALTLW